MKPRGAALVLAAVVACGVKRAEKNSDGAEALQALGKCAEATSWTPRQTRAELNEVINACRNAIDLGLSAPRAATAYCHFGIALQKRGEHERSIPLLREAIALRSDFAEAHYRMGEALSVQARSAQIAEESSAQAFPRKAVTGRVAALYEEAARAYREAVRDDKRRSEASWGLGWVLWQLERRDEAIRFYRQAIEADPRDANKHLELGKALNYLGQYAESVVAFETARRVDRTTFDAAGSHHEILRASRRGERWWGWDDQTQQAN